MERNKFSDRFKRAWNAFNNAEVHPATSYKDYGMASSNRPDRIRFTRGNEKSTINSIYTRIALDVAALQIRHCRTDENGRYVSDIDSGLNNCLNLEANIDQTARALIQDIVMSMFDEGVVAVVPVVTDVDPNTTDSYSIITMRTGKITQWYPKHVKVRLYDDRNGKYKEIVVPKADTAIIENPFYSVINEPNSTMKRLSRKLALLDYVDEQAGSGKIDMIIQLPYSLKTPAKKDEANRRRKDIEMQLEGSRYGIAYIDATEKVTQLNRSLDNNLLGQTEKLTSMLYSQLGITQGVLDGTADEQTMRNYHTRAIEPIVSAIVDEFKRKFLTQTGRTQGQTVMFFQDPFKLVPVANIADIADKFTRNEIMTSNELRQVIGMKPSDDPKADMLVNSNLNQSPEMMGMEDEYMDENLMDEEMPPDEEAMETPEDEEFTDEDLQTIQDEFFIDDEGYIVDSNGERVLDEEGNPIREEDLS